MREIKYTTRFQRDYKREKSGRHGRKLDALLMEVVNLLAADTPLPRRNFDHPLPANGMITATATFAPTSFSSTASPTMPASNLSGSAPTANSVSKSARRAALCSIR
jgi:hypothetical protein